MRFIERFPTVESLAEAPEDEVMRLWQGLGYYSRARNLHAAAQQVVALGSFPTTFEGIRELRGVGDYTAAAIASFAFDIPKAAVDGNVCRVWSRVFGIDEPIDAARGKQMIADIAQALLPTAYAAKYNQAAMEFGALQCVPKSPDCVSCPLADKCVALAEDRVAQLPAKAHKTKVTNRYLSYLYIHNHESLLLHKRTADDIWKNLYELPLIETFSEVDAEALLATQAFTRWREMLPEYTYKGCAEGVKHVLSHRVLHAAFHELEVQGHLPCPEGFVVVPFDDLHHYALPRLIERYLENENNTRDSVCI
jgi:A/G-specific adenine glycosylase